MKKTILVLVISILFAFPAFAGNPFQWMNTATVERDVKAELAKDYPDSYITQKMLFDSNMKAFEKLRRISSSYESDKILNRLKDDYYPSLNTIEMLYNSNMKAYKELNR